MIPTSWSPYLCVISSPYAWAGPTDSFLTNRLGQKGWMSLLRLGYKKTVASVLLAFSYSLTYSEGSQLPCCEMASGWVEGHVAVDELPSPANGQG